MLETRIAPAILTPTVSPKGVLTVQHDPASMTMDDLTITQTGPTTFTVAESNANTSMTFTGVKAIVVTEGSDGSTIGAEFSADGLLGALTMAIAGGDNMVTLTSADGTSGQIGGAVKITTGDGADKVYVNGGLAIKGTTLVATAGGTDSFTPDGAYFAKLLTLDSTETITVQQNFLPVVMASLLVENDEVSSSVSFALSGVAVVTGKLTYCGSATEMDTVNLGGQFDGPVNLMLAAGPSSVTATGSFASKVVATSGDGDDSVTFDGGSVSGALTLALGAGTNAVTLTGGSYFSNKVAVTTLGGGDTVNLTQMIIAKNLALNLGNGANAANGPATSGADFIGKAFTYLGGSDNDTLALDGLIAGTMAFKLGNGTNDVSGALRLTGTKIAIAGGLGVDTVEISVGSVGAALSAKLGAGDDSFNFMGGALGSATLDGGLGTDTLTGANLLPVKQKVKGFEM